jgi:NAD(P)-dependent dehydrogenase (short-subunit alcohol dehydrogenase family)
MSNSKDFSGKVVIVTGSSSGIGEAIAIHLSQLGAQLVITGRNEDNVKRVAKQCLSVSPKGLKPLQVIADITKDEDAKRLIETTAKEFGKIDVLVNNAGAGWLTIITDPNVMENYEQVMKIDLRAVVYLVHLAIPYLEKTKGNIVNISSVGAIKPVICKQFSKQ